MISRRIIRTKVLQVLYAYYSSEEKSINNTEKELFFCIQKAYDLYHFLFSLVVEIADYAENRIEIKRNKHQPTYEELHPNTKFISNQVIRQLRYNKQLSVYQDQKKLSWADHPELIKELYLLMIESESYKSYMADKNRSYLNDRKFIEKLFKRCCGDLVPRFHTVIRFGDLKTFALQFHGDRFYQIGIVVYHQYGRSFILVHFLLHIINGQPTMIPLWAGLVMVS